MDNLTRQVGQTDDGIGNKIYINRYDAAFAEKEEDAAYATDMRTPKIPVVVNENSRNQYGSPRGYKIQLNRPLLNLEPAGYSRSKALGEYACLTLTFHGLGVCCACVLTAPPSPAQLHARSAACRSGGLHAQHMSSNSFSHTRTHTHLLCSYCCCYHCVLQAS